MKRKLFFVEAYAKVEKTISQNLSDEFGIDERASRIMKLVKDEVSEDLFNSLIQEL